MKATNKYVFFYSSREPFSNWFPCELAYDGKIFHSSEHLLMFRKAMLMGDKYMADKITKCKSPSTAKKYGRQITPWNEGLWKEHRERIMLDVLEVKFHQCEHFCDLLMKDEWREKMFVEASPTDCIWGIGMKSTEKGIEEAGNWRGKNLLGKALTTIRDKHLT